jgi:hypothetical protein
LFCSVDRFNYLDLPNFLVILYNPSTTKKSSNEVMKMLKLQVEGLASEVKPFMMEIEERAEVIVEKHENFNDLRGSDQVCIRCSVDHLRRRRVKVVRIIDKQGIEIHIPLLDLMDVDLTDGRRLLTGWAYDIFSSKQKKSH